MPGKVSIAEIEATWADIISTADAPDVTLRPTIALAAQTIEVRLPDGKGFTTIEDVYRHLRINVQKITEQDEPTDASSHYQIEETIGKGGMGIVYRARQMSTARTIALKVIQRPHATNRVHRNLFLTEAMVTANLEHPNIVPIYDVGARENGAVFYAMKEVLGTEWHRSVKHIRLDENLNILLRVADAVAFAHSRGVIHRDLKPANIMLGNCGEVLVMDWGLAASVARGAIAGRIGEQFTLAGTPAYMSPEMACGDVERIGIQSDVYLLGAILFEIISGKRPHAGLDTVGCLVSASNNEIQDTDYKGELLDIALKAMATKQKDRYADVKEFQSAVLEYRRHNESIALAHQAAQHLEEAERSGVYERYDQAIFGFSQALELWPGNRELQDKLGRARLLYATRAFESGDLDIAVLRLDHTDASHADLLAKVLQAGRTREGHKRKMILLAVGLLVVALFLIIMAVYWFRH